MCFLPPFLANNRIDPPLAFRGGGNVQNIGMDRSRPPLRWMAQEAADAGLRLQEFERELPLNQQIEFQESLTGGWRLLEYFPFKRLSFEGPKDLTRMYVSPFER
jgi:hypothetical protein